MLMLAVLVFTSAAFLLLPVSIVMGQNSAVNISSVTSGSAGNNVIVHVQGTISTANGSYLIFFNNDKANPAVTNTSVGYTVNTVVGFSHLEPGNYTLTLQDVTFAQTNGTTIAESTMAFRVVAEGVSAIPIAALMIMGVAVAISFLNMSLNRALITKMIGWREYRSMQREMSEYNSQRMAAVRARDEKTLEKLKKKESQIQSMQSKMLKPQFILLGFSLVYFLIWPLLTGYFPVAVAYVPGFGPQPFFIWYLICSFFFGTVAGRVLGVTPIQ
jgi:uncharacterized membrane protein (DUF106 family)